MGVLLDQRWQRGRAYGSRPVRSWCPPVRAPHRPPEQPPGRTASGHRSGPSGRCPSGWPGRGQAARAPGPAPAVRRPGPGQPGGRRHRDHLHHLGAARRPRSPTSGGPGHRSTRSSAAVFLLVVIPLGVLWGEGWLRSGRRWIQEGRPPTDAELTAVLRAPLRLFFVHATTCGSPPPWCSRCSTRLVDVELLARVAFTVVLGGLTTSGFAYLLAERILRPLAKAALSITPWQAQAARRGDPHHARLDARQRRPAHRAGHRRRSSPWPIPASATATKLAVTMLVLGGSTGLVVGLVDGPCSGPAPWPSRCRRCARASPSWPRATSTPGIEVSDGSVLGLLQSGFNDMAAGLQEREQLRDLYGRQVGEDVAMGALERGSELGGDLREVAVLFVDVVGSTELAATRPPHEVVGPAQPVLRRGGRRGPRPRRVGQQVPGRRHARRVRRAGRARRRRGRALATARAMARRLPEEVPELAAGIGVAFGTGGGRQHRRRANRFEFTVIGDPGQRGGPPHRAGQDAHAHGAGLAEAVEAADRRTSGPAAAWPTSGAAPGLEAAEAVEGREEEVVVGAGRRGMLGWTPSCSSQPRRNRTRARRADALDGRSPATTLVAWSASWRSITPGSSAPTPRRDRRWRRAPLRRDRGRDRLRT